MSKPEKNAAYILRFDEIRAADLPRVGGKNASLGEMYSTMSGAGVPVPPGFAITVEAYRAFLAANGLEEKIDRKSTRLNSSHSQQSRMPSSA